MQLTVRKLNLSGNIVIVLLVINMAMVLLAYMIATITGANSASFAIIRQVFLIASLVIVIMKNKLSLSQYKGYTVILLPVLALFFVIFSNDLGYSFNRLLAFILPYLYLMFSLNYLGRHDYEKTFSQLMSAFLVIYLMPVITYFIFDRGFQSTNIYGKEEGSFFFSNHYGWAATMTIFCSYYMLNYRANSRMVKLILTAIVFVAFFLVLISANRSGLLSIVLAGIIILLTTKSRKILNYTIFALVPLVLYFVLSNIEGSALEFVIKKSQAQLESGQEARFVVTENMIKAFNERPLLWLTGTGMFDYSLVKEVSPLQGYHNSYWEMLFGGGLLVFIVFLVIMVLNPVKKLFKGYANQALIVLPMLIIPFFESNLTGGQFLFYPWFLTMLYFNLRNNNVTYSENETDTAVVQNG